MHFEFVYLYFFLFHLKLIRKILSYAPIVRSKTILDSREKFTPVFRAKRSKNHTLWGGTYLYGLYKGFPPPRGTSNILFSASFICLLRSPQLGTLLKDHYDQQQTL